MGPVGEGEAGYEWREQRGNIHITICKIDSENLLCDSELGLCNNLEGCNGVGGGRETQEGGDTCVPVADSC